MKIISSGRQGLKESTVLAVRLSNYVAIYWTSDWSPKNTFTSLSCGTAKSSPPSGLEIDPTNTWFLTNGTSGTGVYSLSNGSELFFNSNTTPTRGAISKDGDYIAFGNNKDVIIIDTSIWSSTPVHTIASADMDVNMDTSLILAWSHDGTKLAIGDKEGHLQIFNTTDWTAYNSSAIDLLDDVYAMNFSPDDSELAVSLESTNTTYVLNVMTVQATLVSGNILENDLLGTDSRDNCFSSDNELLYGSCESKATSAIESFSTATWLSDTTSPTALTNVVFTIALSNDNKLLAVGENGALQILNADDLTVVSGTPTNSNGIYGVAFDHP